MTTVRQRRLESAAKEAVGQRNYRRARERALTRLAREYPDLYKQFLVEEKERDEALGKKWIDLDGNTGAGARTSDTGQAYADWHTSIASSPVDNEIEGNAQ